MKDFTKLKEYIIEKGEIKTKDALSLGYSSYDLKVFLSQSLLERAKHGVYTLSPEKATSASVLEEQSIPSVTSQTEETKNNASTTEPAEAPIEPQTTIGHPSFVPSRSSSGPKVCHAINSIFTKEYDKALKIYEELSAIHPDSEYYDFCISYVYFLKQEYNEAYSSLLKCYEKNPDFSLITSGYLVLCILKNYVDVPPQVLKSFKSHIQMGKISSKFISVILAPIERGDYQHAWRKMPYFIQNNKRKNKFRIGNRYVYSALTDLMHKLGYDTDFHKKTPEQEIAVPPVSSHQVLTNTILLNAIESHDYETAYRLIEEYEITDAKEIITSLIKKLEEAASKGYQALNTPTKVVAEEETVTYVVTYEEETAHEKVDQPEIPQSSVFAQTSNPMLPETIIPESAPIVNSAPATNEDPIEKLIATKHSDYKRQLADCEFDSARKSLTQYDMLLRDNLKYRDLTYLYDRINRYQAEYTANPANFLEQRERYYQALALFTTKEYDRTIEFLKTMQPTIEVKLLMASAYLSLDNLEDAKLIMSTIEPTCTEPMYYRRMADISYRYGEYQEALNFCFKYNTCKPHRHASIYIFMADCYEKLHKPGKAVKALRIADAINLENGYQKSLSGRIDYFASQAERNRQKRLIKQNPSLKLD